MEIYAGDKVRLKLKKSKQFRLYDPDKDEWLQVISGPSNGRWQAVPTKKRNPLIMYIVHPSVIFDESEILEVKPGPWWFRLMTMLHEINKPK